MVDRSGNDHFDSKTGRQQKSFFDSVGREQPLGQLGANGAVVLWIGEAG
jgi:hypothetical protein